MWGLETWAIDTILDEQVSLPPALANLALVRVELNFGASMKDIRERIADETYGRQQMIEAYKVLTAQLLAWYCRAGIRLQWYERRITALTAAEAAGI